MELKSSGGYAPVEVSKAFEGAVCVQDVETGDAVYLDMQQASQLILALQNAIRTGEVPE